jgi:hypothetical protein
MKYRFVRDFRHIYLCFQKKLTFFQKFLLLQSLVFQVVEAIFEQPVNNFNEKKLLKNLSVSKMAVPLHRFSPQVWR